MKKFIWYVLAAVFLTGGRVYAAELDMSVMDGEAFSDVNESLDRLLGDSRIDFKQMVIRMVRGEEPVNLDTLLDGLLNQVFGEIDYVKMAVFHIMVITIAAAILTNFSNVFNNSQITDISFYIVYMLMLTILMKSFVTITSTASDVIRQLISFMQTLVPAYFIALSAASQITSAMVFYQFILFVITAVNLLFFNLVIPLINIYVVLMLVNNLSKEDFLSRLAQLLKSAVEWLLKCMLTIVIGFNVLQGLLAPAIDSFRTTMLNKTVSVIPGVGNAVNAVTDMVIGSAVLIKNGVGLAAMILILLVCAVPMVKLWIFSLLYRVAAAIIQPVSDTRMVSCISCVGDGVRLLIKVVSTSMILFIITIAVVTAATTGAR